MRIGWLGAARWLGVAAALAASMGANGQPAQPRFNVDVPIRAALSKYSDLLATPGLIVLALQNTGDLPVSRKETPLEPESFLYGIVGGRFLGRRASVFRYEVQVLWKVGPPTPKAVVDLDVGRLPGGTLSAQIEFPPSTKIPDNFRELLQGKTQFIGDADRQKRLVAYLDGLQSRINASTERQQTVGELILLDARRLAQHESDATVYPARWQWILALFVLLVVGSIVAILRDRDARLAA